MQLALDPLVDIRGPQLMGEDGSPITFADLARKARDGESRAS
jgi:hypothetical protein